MKTACVHPTAPVQARLQFASLLLHCLRQFASRKVKKQILRQSLKFSETLLAVMFMSSVLVCVCS